MVAVLKEDALAYGAFRVAAIDRRGTRLSIRPKLVTFQWHGAHLTAKTKLGSLGAARAFAAYFVSAAIDLPITNGHADELNQESVSGKLKLCVHASEFRYSTYPILEQADQYIEQLAKMGIKDEKDIEKASREARAAGDL